jgi:hypothetical protein
MTIAASDLQKLLERHKLQKKRSNIDKELSKNNPLLQKYDTTRILALKAVSFKSNGLVNHAVSINI